MAATPNTHFYEMALIGPEMPNMVPPVYACGYSDGPDAVGKDGGVPVLLPSRHGARAAGVRPSACAQMRDLHRAGNPHVVFRVSVDDVPAPGDQEGCLGLDPAHVFADERRGEALAQALAPRWHRRCRGCGSSFQEVAGLIGGRARPYSASAPVGLAKCRRRARAVGPQPTAARSPSTLAVSLAHVTIVPSVDLETSEAMLAAGARVKAALNSAEPRALPPHPGRGSCSRSAW